MVGKDGPHDEDNAKRRRDEFLQRRGMSGDPPAAEEPADTPPENTSGDGIKPKGGAKRDKAGPPRK